MDVVEKEYYIDSSRAFYRFLISSRQWTGFGDKELNTWIENFSQIVDGEYIACKLLNECIGYSEKDIVLMVKGAISSILITEKVLPKQIETGFSCLKSDIEYIIKDSLSKTLFVPLSVNNAPGESSNSIIRLLTQQMGSLINKQFQFEIKDNCEYERIIIVDDCIGSGEQFKEFWEEKEIHSHIKFRDWCNSKGIMVYYVVLVGYENTVNDLQDLFKDVTIICVEKLKDCHKVLDILSDDQVFRERKEDLYSFLEQCNIRILGFNDMQFAVFIHNNIPDWSLPVFYKQREFWKPLLRRRDSDD